ncbi:MAG: class I SAM-dependent methyltransferase [Armatimonadetes bacterium]|nr:class I SAM-dependent methyltransferase [Armatimonadota bacterium]
MPPSVEGHYARPGLYEGVLQALKGTGKTMGTLSTEDTAAFDEYHVGGRRATAKLIALSGFAPGSTVLDVGCGLGGPARHLAETAGCRVVGLDLTSDFCRAARLVSSWTGLGPSTSFVRGDAHRLPFATSCFDGLWSEHVTMNVPDRSAMAMEAARVLRAGATLSFYEVFRSSPGPIDFPVPWATSPDQNETGRLPDFLHDLERAGFEVTDVLDETPDAAAFLERARARQTSSGPSRPSVTLVMGDETEVRLENVAAAVRSGAIGFWMGRAVKQGR